MYFYIIILLLLYLSLVGIQYLFVVSKLKGIGYKNVRYGHRIMARINPAPGWSVHGTYSAELNDRKCRLDILSRTFNPFILSIGCRFDDEQL